MNLNKGFKILKGKGFQEKTQNPYYINTTNVILFIQEFFTCILKSLHKKNVNNLRNKDELHEIS
jgi:hypothetical protein